MASERGHDGTLPRDGRGRLGEHMGVAHVRATARGEGRAMRERARTGVFAGWLCAAVVLALAPLTPAPAAAHDQSFSYIDLDWQGDRVAVRGSGARADAGAGVGVPPPGT